MGKQVPITEIHHGDTFIHDKVELKVIDVRPPDQKRGLVRFQVEKRSGVVVQLELPEDVIVESCP